MSKIATLVCPECEEKHEIQVVGLHCYCPKIKKDFDYFFSYRLTLLEACRAILDRLLCDHKAK